MRGADAKAASSASYESLKFSRRLAAKASLNRDSIRFVSFVGVVRSYVNKNRRRVASRSLSAIRPFVVEILSIVVFFVNIRMHVLRQ